MNVPLPVTARLLYPADALELAQRTPTGEEPFAGSAPWLRAATAHFEPERLLHVGFELDGELVGHLTLLRTRANWRCGSPGQPTLTWPGGSIGYHFVPRWLRPVGTLDWLSPLRRLFPRHRLELLRCHARAIPVAAPPGIELREGTATWIRHDPGDLIAWLGSLRGKHRRDLGKYRRDIATAGGEWIDVDQPVPELFEACFRLHRTRLSAKGCARGAVDAADERFYHALAEAMAGTGLRLSLLRLDGAFAAACLSFVHQQHYLACVSGWDPRHRHLDLGRQVIHHQLLNELPHGLRCIDLLGGDLAYKREFGLSPVPTIDVIGHPNRGAALRARVADRAIHTLRSLRTRLRPEVAR